MNDERVIVEEIVTKFFLDTCRLHPQLTQYTAQAAVLCFRLAAQRSDDDVAVFLIPLTTGSVAEFYIEPFLPHVGDVDVMYHWNNQLAIPRRHPPPTQLPTEYHNCVRVFEITDNVDRISGGHFPGYVYLELRYVLTHRNDDGEYNAIEYDRQMYALNHGYKIHTYVPNEACKLYEKQRHGPAVLRLYPDQLPSDTVFCMRCLVWPSQAADWPIRHRNYCWPDSATVDHVVNNGCDVVRVAHRQCRQHEWMGQRQWRLSFSRAEIVLINSWTPVQQIVYNMLRVFMKNERLTESANKSEAGTLSNYHIKTLILWACELKSTAWWTDDVSLVRICVELLHDLAVWLTEACCPHYFINNCSLVDSSFKLEKILSRLISVSKSWLSSWFVNKYIRRCSQFCPRNVSWLFDDVSTTTKLQNAVSAVVDCKRISMRKMLKVLCLVEYNMTFFVSKYSLSLHFLRFLWTESRKISPSLFVYFPSLVFLHVACRTSRNALHDELMDALAAVVVQSISPQRGVSRRSSVFLLSKAVNLMKAVDDRPKSHSTVQLIAIELSKAYLYRALRCEDSDSDSIYCLANVYLAVLYYITGQYHTAIDHCILVMRSEAHSSRYSSRALQGDILAKNIDYNIDIVTGLAVFYQHVRSAAVNHQQQRTHIAAFTTELFAHYLYIKCLSVTKCQQLSDTTNSQSSMYGVQSHVKYIVDTQQLFIADVLLWKLVNTLCGQTNVNSQHYGKGHNLIGYSSEMNTPSLVELLQKSAVEHMTTYRQIIAQDFGSVAAIATTDFEALYAYKRGDYQQCLQLSTQIVRMSFHLLMINVSTLPEFIQLLDNDFVSLIALIVISNPKCRDGVHLPNSSYLIVTQLTLSLYLMTQCQLKLRHSVVSLVQTLDYIKDACRVYISERFRYLDRLVLKLIARKAMNYIKIGLR